MFNTERLEKLKRLFQDQDWKFVEEMFQEYISPLKDIHFIELSDSATNIKGEIRVRKQTYQLLDKFLKDARAIAENQKPGEPDPRDSME